MRKKIFITTFLLFNFCMLGLTQEWKKQKQEIGFLIGPTLLYSDVGGADGEGRTGFSGFTDFKFSSTRFAVAGSYRYQLHENIFIKGVLGYTMLSANDKESGDKYRSVRGLNVKTHVMELSVRGEYLFKGESGLHSRYKLQGVSKRHALLDFSAYGILGIGLIYYNPTGLDERTNKRYNLRDLGTNGRGLPGGPSKYSSFNVVIPIGAGIRKAINPLTAAKGLFSVGAELTYNLTFTDNLDDVDGKDYYFYSTKGTSDINRLKNIINQKNGEVSLYMTDPVNYNNDKFSDKKRGSDKRFDSYLSLMFSVYYKLPRKRSSYRKL